MIGEMLEINPTSHGLLFNYPDFPEDDKLEVNINDRLSFIVLATGLDSDRPYKFMSAMYLDK